MSFSPQAPTVAVMVFMFECCPSWERTGCPLGGACAKAVPHCRLSSTRVTHDIDLNDVHKCQPFREPAPLATLFERRKNRLNVAQCGSRAARFRLAPCRVACWLRPKSRAHAGQMWGTSPFIPHSAFRTPHFSNVGECGVHKTTPVAPQRSPTTVHRLPSNIRHRFDTPQAQG